MSDATLVPRPRENELPNGDLVVSSHWVHGVKSATTVDADDRPLYRLLMEVLEDKHVPDTMPARLATECGDLVDVKRAVEDIERGRAGIGGSSYGLSYLHTVRDAIETHRDRDPLSLVAVGCSGSKHDVDEAVPAADLYRGPYWSCKRKYYETIADEGRIISAEHAVLEPGNVIEYYETHIKELDDIPVDHDGRLPSGDDVLTMTDRWAFDIYNELSSWLEAAAGGIDPDDVELEILLGMSYRERLEDRGVFDGVCIAGDLEISFPFQEEPQAQGGNGYQMGWMTDEVEAARTVATDGGERR